MFSNSPHTDASLPLSMTRSIHPYIHTSTTVFHSRLSVLYWWARWNTQAKGGDGLCSVQIVVHRSRMARISVVVVARLFNSRALFRINRYSRLDKGREADAGRDRRESERQRQGEQGSRSRKTRTSHRSKHSNCNSNR